MELTTANRNEIAAKIAAWCDGKVWSKDNIIRVYCGRDYVEVGVNAIDLQGVSSGEYPVYRNHCKRYADVTVGKPAKKSLVAEYTPLAPKPAPAIEVVAEPVAEIAPATEAAPAPVAETVITETVAALPALVPASVCADKQRAAAIAAIRAYRESFAAKAAAAGEMGAAQLAIADAGIAALLADLTTRTMCAWWSEYGNSIALDARSHVHVAAAAYHKGEPVKAFGGKYDG